MRGIRLKKTEEYELRDKIMFKKRVEFEKIRGKWIENDGNEEMRRIRKKTKTFLSNEQNV